MPENKETAFFRLTPDDLRDPTLHRVNTIIDLLASNLSSTADLAEQGLKIGRAAEAQAKRAAQVAAAPPLPPPSVSSLPDVGVSSERVEDDNGKYRFAGTLSFDTSATNYNRLAGIEINFHGPLTSTGQTTPDTSDHIMGIIPAPSGSGVINVTWTSDSWDRPAQTEYFKIRHVKVSDAGDRIDNTPFESALLQVKTLDEEHPIPDVSSFQAGKRQPDGSYTASPYWNDDKSAMAIDWQARLPASTVNWAGMQVYALLPSGSYVKLTGFIPLEAFWDDGGPQPVFRSTIFINRQDLPLTQQTWRFIAVSTGKSGNEKTDSSGNPSGPFVDLTTLVIVKYVQNFSASVQIEWSESGDQLFRLSGSWANPSGAAYIGVRIIMRGFGPGDITLADEYEGSSSFRTDAWPVPDSPKSVTIYAVPIFSGGEIEPIIPGTTPSAPVTIQRLQGGTGIEYAPVVTNFQAGTPSYATNADGQRVLVIPLSWSNPSDPKFGGVVIYVIWVDGQTYQLTGVERGTSLRWETIHYPSAPAQATFYALSLDTNNRRNSYVPGVTPSATVTIPAPTLGPAGTEYCQNVTSFTITVTYPATSDGTRTAQVTATFTRPSDPRWGSVQIVATSDGTDFSTWAISSTSPVTISRPELAIPLTYEVYAVSVDVNGRANSIVTSGPNQTPKSITTIGSSASQLDLSKAKPTSYDPNIFVIQSGQFTVWAMNGSLIVNGSISSEKLNATEIAVGGGGGKPGRFSVFNALGQWIGFIGVYGSWQGGWMKEFRAGGNDPSTAPFVTDSLGRLSIRVGATGTTAAMDETSTVGPLVITNGATGRRIWLSNDATYGTGIFGDPGVAFLAPYFYMATGGVSYPAEMALVGSANHSMSAKFSGSIARFEVRISNLSRTFTVDIDNVSTSHVILNNMGIKVDAIYEGLTGTVYYLKPDQTTGSLSFRRGILVGAN